MTERKQFRAVRGTRDILPPDSRLWNWFERSAREVFESFNFLEIRSPILEETDLFAHAVGADTDIVGKEMFTFQDRAERLEPPKELAAFGEYLAQVKRLLESGRIPRSAQNESAVDRFAQAWEAFRAFPPDTAGSAAQADSIYRLVLVQQSFQLGSDLTLRPEATASVVRAYIEHGMQALPGNRKLYYVGPMFRRERPQKGRYRQFYQIGAEVLGPSDAPGLDAEVIEMLLVLFARVGLTGTTLYVNSIGCQDCRPKYVELLREELRRVKDGLGPDSQRRMETNPLRVLDSKRPEEQEIISTLPRISDHLCDGCREHFAQFKRELDLRGTAYQENWRLVRGLDYYTRTTFEVTAEGLGSQNAVCGGGRYDGLVELLGGPPTKGIGFAIGTDRAMLSIEQSGKLPKLPGLEVFVAWMGAQSYPAAVRIARKLRDAGLAVELPAEEMKFKKSLGLADKLGARYALILGEDETSSATYTLKRLADADQQRYSEAELLAHFESERKGTRA